MKFKKKELWTLTKLKLNDERRKKDGRKFFSKAMGCSMVDVKQANKPSDGSTQCLTRS